MTKRFLLVRGREWCILDSETVGGAISRLKREHIDVRSAEVGFTDPITNAFVVISAKHYIREHEQRKQPWWKR